MTADDEALLRTSLDVLEEYFGAPLGPTEIEAVRDASEGDLKRVLQLLDEFYSSPKGFPARRAGEYRAFPSMFNYRDIDSFCHKHWKAAGADDSPDWGYLKDLELPSEILKLLLYYETIQIVDPVSIAFRHDYHRQRDDYNRDALRASLANAVELLAPLSPWIKERAILIFPEWSPMRHLGHTQALDQLECEDAKFQELCQRYHIRIKHAKPAIFVGSIAQVEMITRGLSWSGLEDSEALLHSALINGYLSFSAALDADFIAQNAWTWDVLRYKIARGQLEFPTTAAASVPAALECIDVADFDDLSTDDLGSLRKNDEAFAAWRADLASTLALGEPAERDFREAVRRFDVLSTEVLPRRAAEIDAAINKTSLKQHLSDAAFAFSAALLVGVREGDLQKALTGAVAGSSAGLLMSILFRRPQQEQKTLYALYSLLAKRDKNTGWVTDR